MVVFQGVIKISHLHLKEEALHDVFALLLRHVAMLDEALTARIPVTAEIWRDQDQHLTSQVLKSSQVTNGST